MKPQRAIVILFCIALGLVAAIMHVKRSAAGTSPAQAASRVGETPGNSEAADTPVRPQVRPRAASPKAPPFTWRQVESEDYKKYIANLRAIGCPEQTIRDIILADVNKLYAAREASLKSKPNALAETGKNVTAEELEKRRQLRELQLEKNAVIKELLGIDLPLDLLPSSSSRDYDAFAAAFKFLPQEKRGAVQSLQENYWQQSDALKAKYQNRQTPEYLADYRQLTDSLRSELGKILTPRELEDYDLRTSSTAKKLSTQLATTFAPTEEEFRQIFRAARNLEEKQARLATVVQKLGPQATPEERQAVAQARAAVEQERAANTAQSNEQLKSALGEQRYADYQRSQDSTYELLTRLGKRYALDSDTVLKAYELLKSSEKPPAPGSDPAQVTRQLNEGLVTVLGDTAARAYRRVRSSGDTVTFAQ